MVQPKKFNDSYIYNKYPQYTKMLTDIIINADRIGKKNDAFKNVLLDVKRRQTTSVLLNVLEKDSVVLLHGNKPLPSAFFVFAAKDIKDDNKLKIFIDCTSIMSNKDGFWDCKIEPFIAFLISAMHQMIYYTDPKYFVSNTRIVEDGSDCFMKLFCYIIDYLRISGYAENKIKIQYLSAMYYQLCILGKEYSESVRNTAKKISRATEQDIRVVDIIFDKDADFININTFINKLVDVFKFKDFTLDVLLEKWLHAFGSGTQFCLELYPSFSSLLTNAYSGVYLNNQKTIEKCAGNSMVSYTTDLFNIAKDLIG